jgi:hypothetical protein
MPFSSYLQDKLYNAWGRLGLKNYVNLLPALFSNGLKCNLS